MRATVRPCLGTFLALSMLTGVVYPLAVTAIAHLGFRDQATGSLVVRDGHVVGSRLLGQQFTQAAYFWGRPSATGPQPYNGGASGGSNLGPTNPALRDAIRDRVALSRRAGPASTLPIPVDLVTSSGSGLDPHISPAAAEFQVPRVAAARRLDETYVRQLVAEHTELRTLGVIGEPRVNVLELNLALDSRP